MFKQQPGQGGEARPSEPTPQRVLLSSASPTTSLCLLLLTRWLLQASIQSAQLRRSQGSGPGDAAALPRAPAATLPSASGHTTSAGSEAWGAARCGALATSNRIWSPDTTRTGPGGLIWAGDRSFHFLLRHARQPLPPSFSPPALGRGQPGDNQVTRAISA